MSLRVGAWRQTGSRTSGGTHMRHRLPCCWKWTSSSAQRSTSGSTASRRSFFYRRLQLRVGLGDLRARFAEPETQLAKEPLALAHLQGHPELLLHESRQQGPVPQLRRKPVVGWRPPQRCLDLRHILWVQSLRPARSLALVQGAESTPLETAYPFYHGSRRIPKGPRCFPATHPLGYQQHPVQPMIVTGIGAATYLVLQRQDHLFPVGYRQCLHMPQTWRSILSCAIT